MPLFFEESIDCPFMVGPFLSNICQFYIEQDMYFRLPSNIDAVNINFILFVPIFL